MEITLVSSTRIADTLYRFRFTKPAAIDFDAGDYVELELEFGELGGRRWFTIASSPTEEFLDIITKVHPKGSDFKQALMDLQEGNTAKISPPIGTFNLPRTNKGKLLWVAGGIGATPYLSMTKWIKEKGGDFDIVTVYVAKPGEFYFSDPLNAVSNQLKTTSERIDQNWLIRQFADLDQRIIYLSGPEDFCIDLFERFMEHGTPRNQLRLDYFTGYNEF